MMTRVTSTRGACLGGGAGREQWPWCFIYWFERREENPMKNTTISLVSAPLQVVTAPDVDVHTLERLRAQFMRPWKVVLHNDDIHSFYDVADALVKSVPGLSAQKAWRITMEAHNEGRAVVTACARKEAELYKERLETFGLTVAL